ncbi:putative chorismate pyruvate-lyase [Gammaproteobacteria bacterium]
MHFGCHTQLNDPHWIHSVPDLRPRAPRKTAKWLQDRGSLTSQVKRACLKRVRVQVLQQSWGRLQYEADFLEMPRIRRAWLREVQILCGEQAWIYARTVIPVTTLTGGAKVLLRLGTKPLGSVLFADPTVVRGKVEVARIQPCHWLYQRAAPRDLPPYLWGRRSVFWMRGQPLLVVEVFLTNPVDILPP